MSESNTNVKLNDLFKIIFGTNEAKVTIELDGKKAKITSKDLEMSVKAKTIEVGVLTGDSSVTQEISQGCFELTYDGDNVTSLKLVPAKSPKTEAKAPVAVRRGSGCAVNTSMGSFAG